MFDEIYIDEVQDLAGYDLDLIELLLESKINLLLVGDNRQATYATNSSARNEKYKGYKIDELFTIWEKKGLCKKEYLSQNYRCNQLICDLADELYPEMPKTESKNTETTGHDGVFLVPEESVGEYISKYSPMILRYDKTTNCCNYGAINFGDSKGLESARVLIFPNGPIRKYLATGDSEYVKRSRAKFYVAITRAKYSVAFVYSGQCKKERIVSLP
jgi:DNA helicase-2/ATP-dependent DNA helicase PcrA